MHRLSQLNLPKRGLIILQFNPKKPPLSWVYARPERILAFGFGSGVIYPGPGTWGTLVGWLLWFLLLANLSFTIAAIVILIAFFVGCFIAQRCVDELGIPDHSGINWDEIVAIWLVLLFTPVGFWYQFAAVVIFRVFDISKPPPISLFDKRFKSGFGVMIDDILAAIYTIIVIYLYSFVAAYFTSGF